MTNREFLATMSDKKLAEFHHQYDCPPNYCDVNAADIDCDLRTCEECWAEWLGLPYSNPDGLVSTPETAWWDRTTNTASPLEAVKRGPATDTEE